MHLISPLANAGFSKFDASSAPPDADPAPIIVWISSIKRIIFSFFLRYSVSDFIFFSKSPLYFVPDTKLPTSRAITS